MQRADSSKKTLMLGKDWGQEEKGRTEDEMAGWHHRLNGHGFGWTPGVGDGQGGLVYCSSWGRKESNTTEWLNWTDWKETIFRSVQAPAGESLGHLKTQHLQMLKSLMQNSSQPFGIHKIYIQSTMNWKYLGIFIKFKKSKPNLQRDSNYLHSIYTVFTTIYRVFTLYWLLKAIYRWFKVYGRTYVGCM